MKITRISWKNFKGLADGEIVAEGRDVIISGRNGAGKSSIAQIIPFVLFGKVGELRLIQNLCICHLAKNFSQKSALFSGVQSAKRERIQNKFAAAI